VKTGDLIHLKIIADAKEGDDITVPDQKFGPFDIHEKHARIEAVHQGKQRFIFNIDLIAMQPGEQEIPPVELRVVTHKGIVGSVSTKSVSLTVRSRVANEPNAELKGPSKPVGVMQDDYTLLYVLGAIVGVILIALLTLLISRWWRIRRKRSIPPPPPRPAWEVALEKLANLRQQKKQMLDEDRVVEFVDQVSDVVREYLGGRYVFDGLESTTDELLETLRSLSIEVDLLKEITDYLYRCDLIKFAKVFPDQEEMDLTLLKAEQLVEQTMPRQRPVETTSEAESMSVENRRGELRP